MAVVDLGFNQTSAGGLDGTDSLLCIQRGLDLKSGWNKTEVFTAMVKPEEVKPLQKAASGLRKTFTKRIPHCRRKRRLTLINT